MDKWTGKVAVVTGVSSGIGAAIAEQLLAAGLKVVSLSRRKDKVDELLSKKLEGNKGKLYSLKTDITNEGDVLEAFAWIQATLGPISILINNAGCLRNTNLIDGNTQMWKDIFHTNVLGLCVATREAVKNMQANNVAGHIIHINSILGHYVEDIPCNSVYPASKYAVTALTETLRQELISIGSKIKISGISPGVVQTEILNAPGCDAVSARIECVKELSALSPEDVADAVLYVLGTPPHVQVHDVLIRPLGGF